MTGRNPPNSLISLLTPEESLFVFLNAVLAAAKSSLLERPAMASSVKPFPFPEKSHRLIQPDTRKRYSNLVPRTSPLDFDLGRGFGNEVEVTDFGSWERGTRYPKSRFLLSEKYVTDRIEH